MDRSIGKGLEEYLFALLAVAVAAIATALLWPLSEAAPLAFFYTAVAVAAWRGGVGPRLTAIVGSALVGAYFFLPARGSHQFPSKSASSILVFLGVSSLIGWLVGGRRVSQGNLRASRSWSENLVGRVGEGVAFVDLPRGQAPAPPRQVVELTHKVVDSGGVPNARGLAELARLVEKAPAFIAVLQGPNHVYQVANAKAQELAGPCELIGRTVAEAAPEAVSKGCVKLLDRVYETGEDFVAPETPVRVDRTGSGVQETRYVNFVYQAMRDPDGAVAGIFVHGVDVTELVESMEAIKQSEARFRLLADAMPQAVWSCRPDGTGEFCNWKWMEYTGLSHADISEEEWRSVVHPDDAGRVKDAWLGAFGLGEPLETEFRFKRAADGEYRWHKCLALPVKDQRGEIVRWIGINVDIHDFKHISEELRQANQRKDEFLATLAHELRNPLAPIRTGLQILEMKPKEDVAASTVEMMSRQLGHMASLIDDLMDLARVGSGKINLRKERVTLQAIAATALERIRPAINDRGHELTVKIADEPIRLEADPTRIGQVISNLLTNAAKYTEPGGRIEVSIDQEGEEAVIRVKDSGVGLAPVMLEKVFEMFSQVGSSIKDSEGGLGIGLTIVKRLVELHGGRIMANSEGPGFGSEFVVRLPLVDGGDERTLEPESTRDDEGGKGGLRVLVVDDNHDSADTLAKVVAMAGHHVRVAYDGESALAAAEGDRPDLVLLDIGLPGLNGYEVAARIRRDPALRETKLVAVTGWGQAEDRRRSTEAGFDFHFVKPVDLGLLQTLLESGVDALKREDAAPQPPSATD